MIKSVHNLVLIEVYHLDRYTSAPSIILPDAHGVKSNVMEFYGLVIDIGPNNRMPLKPGDKILFQRNEGFKVKATNGKTYFALRPERILAKIC
jgi:co-chaperonin GroES (HSP10)